VSRVPRYVVVHEAGHAVLALIGCRAVCGNDGAFDFIEVRRSGDYTPIETRHGNLIHARGIVAGCQLWQVRPSKDGNGGWCEGRGKVGFIAQELDESCRVNYLLRAAAQARISLAGPCAQAELPRQSLPRILKQHGRDDYHRAMACIRDASDTEEQAIAGYQRIVAETGQFVRQHWRAIEALADRLQTQHRLELEEALPIIGDVA
jgi:hypothetical protein